jgi:glycosyltransferase involved in cell wall biosynthesis
LDTQGLDPLARHLPMVEQVFQQSGRFDLIHWHTEYLHFPLARRQPTPQVTTLHGRLDLLDLVPFYQEFTDVPVISISDAQRQPLPGVNWQGTVYHGLPEELYTFRPEPGTYLAFLGRISPEKRVDRAIAIAQRLGLELKIAAKVDPADRAYFEAVIAPLLREPLIEYVGEIGEGEKNAFLGHASTLLFPIDWPEPFGLVMAEAMACGTPVIAYRRGSVPEIIEEGVTGFIVHNLKEAVRAVERLPRLRVALPAAVRGALQRRTHGAGVPRHIPAAGGKRPVDLRGGHAWRERGEATGHTRRAAVRGARVHVRPPPPLPPGCGFGGSRSTS